MPRTPQSRWAPLPDHLVRLVEHRGWNCNAELLGCLQVDDQVELCRLFDGKVRRLRTFQDSIAALTSFAAWFGGAKRIAEPGCERSERRILADVRSMSARMPAVSRARKLKRGTSVSCRVSAPLQCSAQGRAQAHAVARPLTRLLPALWYAYAASVDGTCFKYARISALTRSISAR